MSSLASLDLVYKGDGDATSEDADAHSDMPGLV